MQTRIRLGLVTTLVALGLSSAVACAETLTISPARELRLVSLGAIRFEAGLGVHVDCNMTLSGSFTTSSFASTRGTSIGSVERSTVSGCTGGTVTPLVEARTPWRVVYEEVDGRFPQEVTGYQLKLEGVRLLGEISAFASCLYTSNLGIDVPVTLSEHGEARTDIISRTGLARLQTERQSYSSIVRLSGPFNCPTAPTISGTFRLEPQQSIRQEGTRTQIQVDNVNFTAEEVRTATLLNRSTVRNEQLEQDNPIIYTREGDATRFIVVGGGTCTRSTTLSRDAGSGGGSCTINIRADATRPASSRLAIDFFTIDGRPGKEGNLIRS